jgi:plasmid stabilization system protein ParE
MAAELVISPAAGQDLAEAYAWYEHQRAGLGEDFLSCVDACIQGIARNPMMHPTVHQNYRRALVRRFPYAIFYEFAGSRLTVYSIFHTSQSPQKWRQRLPDQ